MAIFFRTNLGDFYGGPNREAVEAAIGEDGCPERIEFEVPGSTKVSVVDENCLVTDELTTLDEEYDEALGAYCVASED